MQEIQEIIDNRTFLNNISLKSVKVYAREDNVKFIMCVNEARYDLACILRYDHCLDIWEHEDYTFIIKQKFDDLMEEFEVIKEEVTREEVIRENILQELEHVHDEIFERLKALEETIKAPDIETLEIDYEKIKELFKSFKINMVIIDFYNHEGTIKILAMSEDRKAVFLSVDYLYSSVTFIKVLEWFEGKSEYYSLFTGS